MSTIKKTGIALALALATTSGLAACGDEKPPAAKDAWNKAQDRVGQYKTLKIDATGSLEGKNAKITMFGPTSEESLDMDFTVGDGHASMITVGGKQYTKGDAAFYKANAGSAGALAEKLADKWIETPKSSSSSDMGMKSLIKDMQDDSKKTSQKLLSDKATVTKDSVDGKDAWKITSEDKKTSAWVTRDDKYDVLKVEGAESNDSTGKNSFSTMTFPEHDKTYDIKAPADAKSMTDLITGN